MKKTDFVNQLKSQKWTVSENVMDDEELIFRKGAVAIVINKKNHVTFKILSKKDSRSLVSIQFKNVEDIFMSQNKKYIILRLWAIDYQFLI